MGLHNKGNEENKLLGDHHKNKKKHKTPQKNHTKPKKKKNQKKKKKQQQHSRAVTYMKTMPARFPAQSTQR